LLGDDNSRNLEKQLQEDAATTEQEAGQIGGRVGREAAHAAVGRITSEVLEKRRQAQRITSQQRRMHGFVGP
jgi:hypothetical protein